MEAGNLLAYLFSAIIEWLNEFNHYRSACVVRLLLKLQRSELVNSSSGG